MDIRYKLYPYPVLADYSDDYINCSFETAVDIEKEGYNLKINFLASLDNDGLLELISNNKASIAYHLECAQTGFRTVVMTKNLEDYRLVQDKNICGRFKICPFIVAIEDINNYVNEKFNEDYRGFKFQIEAGCVMAVGQQATFEIEKDRNEFVNAKSIFVITKDADPNALEMSIEIERNKITIKLPEKDYLRYKSMHESNEVQNALNSMIIIPSLMYVLSEISNRTPDEREIDFGNYNWYKSIRKALKKRFKKDLDNDALELYETISYAQKLIMNPLSGALEYLAFGYNGEEDEE